jgi:broad specificity phosphatase PhoE
MSLRLTLIAHAATEATRAAKFPLDEPLEATAYTKAAALAGHLGRVDAAWTSPALRAVQTVEALGLRAVVDPVLADIDLGQWGGKSLTQMAADDATGLARWMDDPSSAPHGGESIESLLLRIAHWLDKIGDGTGRVVGVTHAAVIRAVALIALGAHPRSFWRIDIEPLSFSRFDAHSRRWTVRCLNAEIG